MSFQNLKNHMEVLVEESIDTWLKKGESFCPCPRCRLDATAFALNRLPSKYVVTPEGEKYAQLESLHLQSKTDVMARVLEAMRLVSERPRH